MKVIEAIKIVKGLIASVELVYKTNPLTDKEPHPETDALTLAISALKKQEPMKPLQQEMDIDGRAITPCGFCGEELPRNILYNFCPYCGQAIDWRKE
jgi:hypothetical protein